MLIIKEMAINKFQLNLKPAKCWQFIHKISQISNIKPSKSIKAPQINLKNQQKIFHFCTRASNKNKIRVIEKEIKNTTKKIKVAHEKQAEIRDEKKNELNEEMKRN